MKTGELGMGAARTWKFAKENLVIRKFSQGDLVIKGAKYGELVDQEAW